VVILLEELGLLGETLDFIANPLDAFGDLIAGIAEDVDQLLPDIEILNEALAAVGFNADKANESLDELKPNEGTDTATGSESEDSTPGPLKQFASAAAGGIGLGVIGGTLGAVAGSVVPGAGTLLGAATGASLGTAVGGALGLASAQGDGSSTSDTTPDVDASSDDSGAEGLTGQQPNQPTVINNNNITVNGAQNPTQTRASVRRAVEEANRQQRNAEDGRVD
jgi:hypothetical protein